MPKREPGSSSRSNRERDGMDRPPQAVADRRALRSRYSTVKTIIHDERENITKPDSNKFDSIFNEMESLHELVQNPREQVADAEALLGIANTLMTSVNAHRNEGITPTDFINCLIRYFGKPNGSINWNELGKEVSHIFQTPPKCCTMIGPMDVEAKQRKSYVRRKRVNPSENDTPEELKDAVVEEETETVKNVATMFNILRKVRRVRLENLILNRVSFAQTVENLFALSFLVKDGRAEIKMNEEGHHLVAPRNAPSANAITSGEVTHCHFVFRLDFKDWKLMKDSVRDGEQLMPHRVSQLDILTNSQFDQQCEEPQVTATTTPIRKFTRNRGLVLQEHPVGGGVAGSNQPVVEDTPVCNYMDEDEARHTTDEDRADEARHTTDEDRAAVIRKGKHKML